MYQSLYRKYRPRNFSEVLGQNHIIRTLKNQIKTGRIGHAYLFCGTRGTGKTSVAKIFAKAVNCPNSVEGEPCNRCQICESANNNSLIDIIEIDAASNNSVDDVRELRDNIIYAPSICKYKVYIIDEVHMLSGSAFNALLKTLEEPPSHAIFILATTEPNKIPATILSRCQRFDFKRIPSRVISQNIKKIAKDSNISIENSAIAMIARHGNGSMRDAISILEQCVSYNDVLTYDDVCDILGTVNDDTLYTLVKSINDRNAKEVINQIDKLMLYGIDVSNLIKAMLSFLRDVVIYKTCGTESEEILETEINDKILKASEFDMSFLSNAIEKLIDLQGKIRYAQSPRILFEITVLKLINPEISPDIDSILDRIKKLENRLNNVKVAFNGENDAGIISKKDVVKSEKGVQDDEVAADEIKKEHIEITESADKSDKIDVNEVFNKALNIIKKDRPMIFSFLSLGKPYLKDGNFMIEYPKEHEFYKDELNKVENKDYIKDIIKKLTGKDYIVNVVVKKNENDELIEAVKKYFGDVEIID
ncbi:DNA polymerase III subunit gamma/tau [Thermoanaerobacterium thermosaccharolyticum]|uniref:DNA polymerase III subunit gamma/tau n=1 Tax=Thermoanaerobacterium thermosaccharolyticum TaxID=1517 RepID=UPI0020A50E2F|nr:DNA polymerase III subunit gamma/tau [Thermoanaerobacterium thermosaccharolyticum]MCP2240743.1 DNA polymerase-3 subunit gamma/tau [Thermoanaerobacterium thermosaccharolyticum]